jgi:hypothetical protein
VIGWTEVGISGDRWEQFNSVNGLLMEIINVWIKIIYSS